MGTYIYIHLCNIICLINYDAYKLADSILQKFPPTPKINILDIQK